MVSDIKVFFFKVLLYKDILQNLTYPQIFLPPSMSLAYTLCLEFMLKIKIGNINFGTNRQYYL